MPTPHETLYLPDLLDGGKNLAPQSPSRLKQRAQVVMWGATHPSGIWRDTAYACHRRPERKACKGMIMVRRQDVPAEIDWECSVCGASGAISGWQGTEFHLEEQSLTEEEMPSGHPVSLDAHRLLCELAVEWPELRELAFGAFVRTSYPDGAASDVAQFVLIAVGPLGSHRAAIAERLVQLISDETRPKRKRLLQELVLIATESESAENEDRLV